MPLADLHGVLQIAFDWDDYHLHSFETACGEFGPADTDDVTTALSVLAAVLVPAP
jgi:hypothetical protein